MGFNATKTNEVRSVSRAISILEVLAEEGKPLGLVAISQLTKLNPTTAYRILQTLLKHSFVVQNQVDGKYSLGFRVFQIGNNVRQISVIRQIARPFLQTLMERARETANMAVRDDLQVTYVEQVTGLHFLRTFTEVGRGAPLHATAVGKALLFDFSQSEWERLEQNKLKKYTQNTITSISELKKEIEISEKRGYTIDFEEFEKGMSCIGAPIYSSDGKILCSISISGPITRLSKKRIENLVPLIVSTAAEISQALRMINFHDLSCRS